MKTIITGTTGLASQFIKSVNYLDFTPIRVGHAQYVNWKDFDVFINLAHVGFSQVDLLDLVSREWKDDPEKWVINISSRASQPNISKGHLYASQKAALDHYANNLTYNSDKKFRMTTLNLGLLEHPTLPSLTYKEVVDFVEGLFLLPWHIETSTIYLQHSENYQSVQRAKANDLKTQ